MTFLAVVCCLTIVSFGLLHGTANSRSSKLIEMMKSFDGFLSTLIFYKSSKVKRKRRSFCRRGQ